MRTDGSCPGTDTFTFIMTCTHVSHLLPPFALQAIPSPPSPLQTYTFDEAHPALADQHYLRTMEQNRMLEQERTAVGAAEQAEVASRCDASQYGFADGAFHPAQCGGYAADAPLVSSAHLTLTATAPLLVGSPTDSPAPRPTSHCATAPLLVGRPAGSPVPLEASQPFSLPLTAISPLLSLAGRPAGSPAPRAHRPPASCRAVQSSWPRAGTGVKTD